MARAHHTTLPQNEPEEGPGPVEVHVPRRTESRSTADAWLVAAGVLMMLTGLALVVVPTLLPQYAWIARSLAARGVTSLPIAIGGVLMCGLVVAGRSRREATPLVDHDRGTRVALDTLSQQVAQIGDALQGIRIEFVYLKDALQTQLERLESSRSSDNAGDAVYRLAASLDQVGMRIEERVAATNREVAESVKALGTALETLRTESAGLQRELETKLEKQIEEVRRSAEESQPPRHPLDDADDDYAEAWDDGTHEHPPHASRLGLLDMLDDLGRLLPRKEEAEAPIDVLADPFEGSQDEGWKQAASVPSPLPSLPRDEQRLAEPGSLLGRGMPRSPSPAPEEPLGEKLEELRGLLADSRVREALAALERSRR